MSPKESVIRLLTIEDRQEDAERVISALRNAGVAVRPIQANSEAELIEALKKDTFDVAVIGAENKTVALGQASKLIRNSGRDLPIVAVLNELTETAILQAFSAGSPHLAPRDEVEMLHFVITAAYSALQNRRAVGKLKQALKETEKRCDALIDSSRDPISYVHEGMHIRANQAYLEMFGFESFEDVEGLSVLDLIAPGDAGEFKDLLKRLSKGEPPPEMMQLDAVRSDGSEFEATMQFAQASYEGEPCLQIIFRRRELSADVARELDALRQRDQTTGLYNRQFFLSDVEKLALEVSEGRKGCAVMLIEVDNYDKLLSDVGIGHTDDLLEAASTRLRKVLSDNDVLSRFGEHTFSAVLRDSDHAATQAKAEAVREAFASKLLEFASKSLTVMVSVAAVQVTDRNADSTQVLGRASAMLQNIVSSGGNKVELFDPSARDRAEEERIRARVKAVEDAISNNTLVLYFQPIISLHGDGTQCYEALLRLRGEDGELVPPGVFLPDLEEHGLNQRLDRWVIGKALALIAERKAKGHETTLFVNITTESLLDEKLPAMVSAMVKKLDIDGKNLVLEIPESKVFTNLKRAQQFCAGIGQTGVTLSLEHFGASNHSFHVLEHVPAAYLRLDRSFMVDLAKNAESQKKVREMADKISAAGRKSIAEFVQDAASMTVLFTSSVNYVQGNFLAPAGPEMNYDFG